MRKRWMRLCALGLSALMAVSSFDAEALVARAETEIVQLEDADSTEAVFEEVITPVEETYADEEAEQAEEVIANDDTVSDEAILTEEADTEESYNTIVRQGTCGETVTWTLDETGRLQFSGTGVLDSTDGSYVNYFYNFEYSFMMPSGNAKRVKKVVIEDGIEEIGMNAFRSMQNLTYVSIPESVVSIASQAFQGCYALSAVTLPEKLTYIGPAAFNYCTTLKSIVIPEGVKELGKETFDNCELLSNVVLPEGLTIIGGHAFYACKALSSIELPSSLVSIGASAFGFVPLKAIDIPNGVTEIGASAFAAGRLLKEVYIPSSVVSIGRRAFAQNPIEKLVLSEGLQRVDSGAFITQTDVNTIKSVKIPQTVTYIGDEAFGFNYYNGNSRETKISDFIVYGGKNSEAQIYAESNEVKFVVCYCKINFNANGGDLQVTSKVYDYDNAYGDLPVPTWTGHTFDGWYTQVDGGELVTADSVCTKDGVTLYAHWTAHQHTIAFDGNGADSGSMTALSSSYGEEYTLPSNAYGKTGYVFAGWNTKADGSGTAYANQAQVSNLTAEDGAEITLYAQWAEKTYTIVFDGNGATGGSMADMKDLVYLTGYPLTAKAFSRTGYDFVSWNTKANGTGKSFKNKASVKGLTEENGGTVILYAQWSPRKYSVVFNGNGADSGEMAGLSNRTYDTAFTLPANTYQRAEFTFTGWNTKADGTGTQYSNKASVKNLTSVAGKEITLYAQWEAKTYTITYELDGGTNSASNPATYQIISGTITLKSPTKKGYTFKGWYSDSTYTVRVKEIQTGSIGNKLLYAKWQVNTYTIAFDGNGATEGELADLPNRSYDVEYTLRTNAYKKTGYVFTGWNTKADGSGTSYANKAVVSNLATKNGAVVTLYAQWRIRSYSIAFDGNGSTSGSTKVMTGCEYDKGYALRANGFKKTGYTFDSWNTKADGSGKAYKDLQTVETLTTTDGATVTLYAQWKVNTYNVVLNGNGADSGEMNPLNNRIYDKEYTLPVNAFKKEGYKFAGWNTKASGSGTSYENKGAYTKLSASNGATVTLYAQWSPRSYSVAFDGNGATGGSTAGISCVYDKSYYLTANGFKRTGYEFNGWNTKADGSGTKYKDGVTVKNLTSSEGKVITLYAQWKAVTYQISYELNGGTNAKENPANYQITTETILLGSPVRTGYTFKGWYKESSFTTKVTKINVGSTGDRTFYAKWEANTYTIAFDGNGATGGSMTDMTGRYYDRTYTLKTNAFKKSGYEFTGWNTKADGTGVSYKNNASVIGLTTVKSATVTLYAQWSPVKYTLTYVLNGGTKQTNPASYTVESGDIILLPATRTGYKFLGWYKENTFVNKVSKISAGSAGNRTFYAKWAPITYTIKFKGNTSTSGATMAIENCEYGRSYELPECGFKKKGYYFVGWSTAADEKDSIYVPGNRTGNLTTKDGAVVYLYAQWEAAPDKYKVYTDAAGNPYDLGGMEIIVRDWWSYNNTPSNEYERATQEYREWIQKTYNFTIKQMAISNWSSATQDFKNYVARGGDNKNYVFILHDEPDTAKAMQDGYMYNLASLDSLDFSEQKFQANLVHKLYSKGNKVYAMHAGASEPRTGVYFNKRILREAGINPDDIYEMQALGTWTWDAFIDLCEKVQRDTNNDGVIDVYACNSENGRFTQAAVYSNGGEFVGQDASGKYVYKLEDKKTLDGLEFAASVINNYWQEEPVGCAWDYYKSAFLYGETAFMVDDAYFGGDINGYLANAGMKDDYGFVMFPKGPAATDYTNLWENTLAVIPSCYDAGRAWKITFAWNLFTNETPGYENSNTWKAAYRGFRDTRAVNETLAMMRTKGMITYHSVIPGLDLGNDLTYNFVPGCVVSDIVNDTANKWKAYVEYANW